MPQFKIKAFGWLKNSKVRWGLSMGIWVVIMVVAVVPTWQGVMTRNQEIHDVQVRLATMDEWTVAGMWLAPSVNARTLPVNGAFSRLFPAQRRREEFFLSLAQVADQSGVENFALSESKVSGLMGNDVWGDGSGMAQNDNAPPTAEAPPTGDGPSAMGSTMSMNIPKVELLPYRVNAEFSGDYQRIAYFMSGLKNIERAFKVHSLVIHPEKDGVQVKLELDVYVSKTSQS